VQLSTAHYVFPALYCNLKRANFLSYLPKDLVAYMQEITTLNRQRNKAIIKQAKKLNTLLIENGCTSIFLKGTGNLLAGLYEDIAERMVGDIDFIFSEKDYRKAIDILYSNDYERVAKNEMPIDYTDFMYAKHYPRLRHELEIAAVEVHQNYLLEEYKDEFNYSNTQKSAQIIDGVKVLSYDNKVNLSIIANQINDASFHYKTMSLRNAYDVFLLSKKTNASTAMQHLKKLRLPLLCFIAGTHEVFNVPKSLKYLVTKATQNYLAQFQKQFTHPNLTRRKHKWIRLKLLIKTGLYLLSKALVDTNARKWVLFRLSDPNWYKQKWKQTFNVLTT